MKFSKMTDGSPEQVEQAVVGLLDSAEDNVRYSTGLYANFYNRAKIRKAFEDAADRVDSFELLLDSHVNVAQAKQELPWLFQLGHDGKLSIQKSSESILHWIIVDDGRSFRLEQPHSVSQGGKSNLVVMDADDSIKDLADDVISTFDEEWRNSQAVE